MTIHDSQWKGIWDQAHKRLESMFNRSAMTLAEVIKDRNGIDSTLDAKNVLEFVFDHGASAEEKACAIVSVFEALMAWHELNENSPTSTSYLPKASA